MAFGGGVRAMKDAVIRYIITPRRDAGVNLSRAMCWGNLPYRDADAAAEAARANANGAAMTIERQGC